MPPGAIGSGLHGLEGLARIQRGEPGSDQSAVRRLALALSPPMAWMGLIVRSRSLDFLRRQTADRAQLTQPFDDLMADTLESDARSPLDTALASGQAWALHQCLAQLEGRHLLPEQLQAAEHLRELQRQHPVRR